MRLLRASCFVIAPLVFAATGTHAEVRSQCVQLAEPSEYFDRSEVVFVGIVLANEATGTTTTHIEPTHIATLRVERVWKGPVQREFTVGADAPFTVGRRYIVFASGKALYTAMRCGWAELEGEAHKKREWLATKPSRRPPFLNESGSINRTRSFRSFVAARHAFRCFAIGVWPPVVNDLRRMTPRSDDVYSA